MLSWTSQNLGGWIPPNRSDMGQYAMKTGMPSKFKSAQIKDLIFSLNMPQIYKYPTSLCRICIYIYILYSIHTCFHLFPGFESSAHPVASFCHCPLGFLPRNQNPSGTAKLRTCDPWIFVLTGAGLGELWDDFEEAKMMEWPGSWMENVQDCKWI